MPDAHRDKQRHNNSSVVRQKFLIDYGRPSARDSTLPTLEIFAVKPSTGPIAVAILSTNLRASFKTRQREKSKTKSNTLIGGLH
ncbi:MAG: hypothetical protein AAF404_16460 [Pseudomonadota bacterium]